MTQTMAGPVTAGREPVAGDRGATAAGPRPVAGDRGRAAAGRRPVAGDRGRAAAGRRPVAGDRDTVLAGRDEDSGQQVPFLHDKLRIPEPCFPVLHRPRVGALLDRATEHRVTLVSGPAGAGKTVACASWAAAGPAAGRVVWLTVDADDQRDWFWAYVCAGLTRIKAAPPGALHAL